MLQARTRIEPIAYTLLAIGLLGDWASTKLGLAMGYVEGNPLAQRLMMNGSWMQTNFLLGFLCFIPPFIMGYYSDSRYVKLLIVFPLLAGLVKLGVTFWNLGLIF